MKDPYLSPYLPVIQHRLEKVRIMDQRLTSGHMELADFASGHEYFGLHREGAEWVFREWAPNATAISLIGDFSDWQKKGDFSLQKMGENGNWEVRLPEEKLRSGQLYKLLMRWPGGDGERIPTYARRVIQDPTTKLFSAQVWEPEHPYVWRQPLFRRSSEAPRIYEAHIGMAQSEEKVGTYEEFRQKILPRVIDAGYNTLQLMAIQEHPYYGSLGYHVSSFFAASSRFGTPEELKALVVPPMMRGLQSLWISSIPTPSGMNWRGSAVSTAPSISIFMKAPGETTSPGTPAVLTTGSRKSFIFFFRTAATGWTSITSTDSALTA